MIQSLSPTTAAILVVIVVVVIGVVGYKLFLGGSSKGASSDTNRAMTEQMAKQMNERATTQREEADRHRAQVMGGPGGPPSAPR